MSGAANPDFATINLLDYLQEGLKLGKIDEVKRYFRSIFTVDEFAKAVLHADGEDTVAIVSTNKIQPEVWRFVINSKAKENYKHIIIDKNLAPAVAKRPQTRASHCHRIGILLCQLCYTSLECATLLQVSEPFEDFFFCLFCKLGGDKCSFPRI